MDDNVRLHIDEWNGKLEYNKNNPMDSEMLKTYGTGLLALCVTGSGKVVKNLLTSGLSAKQMRYLCIRVLGETSTNHKDDSYLTEEVPRIGDEVLLDGHSIESDHDKRSIIRQVHKEEQLYDDSSEGDEDGKLMGEKTKRSRELCNGNSDENISDDSSRHKVNHAGARLIGKGRSIDGALENERDLASPVYRIQLGHGWNIRDRNAVRNAEMKGGIDAKKQSSKNDFDTTCMEREDNDDHFLECKVGITDISNLVKR